MELAVNVEILHLIILDFFQARGRKGCVVDHDSILDQTFPRFRKRNRLNFVMYYKDHYGRNLQTHGETL